MPNIIGDSIQNAKLERTSTLILLPDCKRDIRGLSSLYIYVYFFVAHAFFGCT
jgi:hypothetical protein